MMEAPHSSTLGSYIYTSYVDYTVPFLYLLYRVQTHHFCKVGSWNHEVWRSQVQVQLRLVVLLNMGRTRPPFLFIFVLFSLQ